MLFNKLLEIDKVSDSIGRVNYREAVRGIIIRKNRILMVHSINKDYKFPGGGIKKDEEHEDTLKREIEEETGYICSKVYEQIGIVTERSRDKYVNDKIFEMISYYYLAEVSDKRTSQKLDPYEAKLEFKPEWIDIEEAINNNEKLIKCEATPIANWIYRETYVLKKIKSHIDEIYKRM